MIGLIVDGDGDYAAFRVRYEGVMRVLKADGPRGHSVTADALVNSAKRQVAMLRAFGCSPIAVLTDFEARPGSAGAFCEAARRIADSSPATTNVLFFACDQMLENWILADIAYLSGKKTYLKPVRSQKNYESTNGKQELKKYFKPGSDYNEVRHSPDLFSLVRGAIAAKLSKSFAVFRDELGVD